MPECVISNTSPVFYLHRLRQLELLQKLYGRIIIPEAVVAELQAGQAQGEDVPEIAQIDWIEVRAVRVPRLLRLLPDLGSSEAQALALALEEADSLVVLDDQLAREFAKLQNLRITGTAGILLKAKEQGHLQAVKPLLKELRRLNFRLSDAMIANILKIAQE